MRADAKALEKSMTVEERKALAEISNRSATSNAKTSNAKVTSIRSEKADAKRLRENHSWLSDKS
jgi:hypothetical protein